MTCVFIGKRFLAAQSSGRIRTT